MKRAFANIGFTFAVSLILLNLLSVKWALAAFIAASVLFVLSLCVKKLRRAAAFPISMLSAALACFIFVTYYNSVWMPQTTLYDKTANCSFYITDLEDKTENGYAYTVKTCRIDLNSAPQEIKLKLYTNTLIDAEPYQIIDGTVVFYSAGENGFESHGLFAKGIFASGYAADYRPTEEFKAGISSVNSEFIEMRRQLRGNFSSYIGGDEGALTLAVLTLPLIINTTEEALKQVPGAWRDASLALGATKSQTIGRIVLPAALPGILTGAILAVARAAGETSAVMFTAAVFYTPKLPESVFSSVMALPYHMYVLATAGTEIEKTRPMQYGTGLLLVALVFAMNFVAILIRDKMQKKRTN